jgi:hypothetical protein
LLESPILNLRKLIDLRSWAVAGKGLSTYFMFSDCVNKKFEPFLFYLKAERMMIDFRPKKRWRRGLFLDGKDLRRGLFLDGKDRRRGLFSDGKDLRRGLFSDGKDLRRGLFSDGKDLRRGRKGWHKSDSLGFRLPKTIGHFIFLLVHTV